MSNDHFLLQRLRDVFQNEVWCKTLFEKSEQSQTVQAFSEMLKTASSNHDRSLTTAKVGYSAFRVNSDHSSNFVDLVAAFLSKTPPPPPHRRPSRFNRFHQRRSQQPYWKSGNRTPRQLPLMLKHKSHIRRCWGCNQEGHILRNCPEKHKHMEIFQRLHHIGQATLMIIQATENRPH